MIKEKIKKLKEIFGIRNKSPFEKFLYLALLFILFFSAYASIYKLSMKYSEIAPVDDETWNEGSVGMASELINPVLANTPIDKDLSALIYSGLLRANGESYDLDLAKEMNISEDGKVYTFKLKDNIKFHDGQELSADDIVFTIRMAQNPLVNSPLRANWESVKAVALDKKTLKITLPEAYSPFIDNFTLGILPKHIWGSVKAQDMSLDLNNKKAIGSGPFKLINIKDDEDSSSRIYELESNENFYLGKPHITKFNLLKFQSKSDLLLAWENGNLSAIASVPWQEAKKLQKENKDSKILSKDILRAFAIFFNMRKRNDLSEKKVREAISLAIDKEELVRKVMGGFASPLYAPVPDFMYNASSSPIDKKERSEKIQDLMQSAKWKKNTDGYWEKNGKVYTLNLSLADSNEELEKVANYIQDSLNKEGFKVLFKKYDLATLNSKVIRERDFDALLFGFELGRNPDLYQFWHSSQKDDPGLNISSYKNKEADKILLKLKEELDQEKRKELMTEFVNIIDKDKPAVFLFMPKFIYLVPKQLKGMGNDPISRAEERFSDIFKWYSKSQTVWSFFK